LDEAAGFSGSFAKSPSIEDQMLDISVILTRGTQKECTISCLWLDEYACKQRVAIIAGSVNLKLVAY